MEKTTLQKKLDLRKNLEELHGSIDQNTQAKDTIRKYLEKGKDLEENIASYSQAVLNDLKEFEWLKPIGKVTSHIKEVLHQNPNLFKLQSTKEKLSRGYDARYFERAIEDIEKLSYFDEENLKEQIKNGVLSEHEWIPNVHQVVNDNVQTRNYVYGNDSKCQVTHPISPVSITEDVDGNMKKIQFAINGHVLEADDENEEVRGVQNPREVNKEFLDLLEVVKRFRVRDGKLLFEKGKDLITIDPGESAEDTKTYFNDVEIPGDIESYLRSTSAFGINEQGIPNFINFSAHNAHKLVELDFVENVRSMDHSMKEANIIRIGENVWLNEKNGSVNELRKCSSANDAIYELNQFIGYEPYEFLKDIYEKENKKAVQKIEERNELEDRIAFLNKKIQEIDDQDDSVKYQKQVREARERLVSERDEKLYELGEVYDELGITENTEGFVDGKVLVDVEKDGEMIARADEEVKVDAGEFAKSSKSEKISIKTEKGEAKVKKRFLEVNF